MKIMRILLFLIVLVVLNVIFADRFLIPTKAIPADQIVYSDENPQQAIDRVLLDSSVYFDPNNQASAMNLKTVGDFKVAMNSEASSDSSSARLKVIPNYRAIEMSNGSLELTDMKILIQYVDASNIDVLGFDYGLNKIEVMPAVNIVIFEAQNIYELNNIMTSLKSDNRAVDASFNLVEMSEIPQ